MITSSKWHPLVVLLVSWNLVTPALGNSEDDWGPRQEIVNPQIIAPEIMAPEIVDLPSHVPHHTLSTVATARLTIAYEKYFLALDQAQRDYNAPKDSVSWSLADDELYLAELRAELALWEEYKSVAAAVGAGAFAAMAHKVGEKISKKFPNWQGRTAAGLAFITAIGVEKLVSGIDQRVKELQATVAAQRQANRNLERWLLDQADYGGTGNLDPNAKTLEELFPTCKVESICVDAKVCTTNRGEARDCEWQEKCDHRLVQCGGNN